MNEVYPDETYSDLLWMRFDGPSWNEFHDLMTDLEQRTANADDPFILVFYPTIDLPKGYPVPHITRLIRFLTNAPKIPHFITILPPRLAFARTLANLSFRLFPTDANKVTIVARLAEVHETYHSLKGQSDT